MPVGMVEELVHGFASLKLGSSGALKYSSSVDMEVVMRTWLHLQHQILSRGAL